MSPPDSKCEEEEEEEPPRNFTLKQLHHFDGTPDAISGDKKPIYLSIAGTVFDVSSAGHFYGPEGPYELFAGRECGVAMGKVEVEEKWLDDLEGCEKLNPGEKDSLHGWYEQFRYFKCYPVVGTLVAKDKIPSSDRIITKEELEKTDGSQDIPEGYAAAPIYVGVKDKVFDVSFGGVKMYGKGCSYNKFAGKDVSRALAKMSFDPADLENTDISDLDDKQLKVLDDWCKNFEEKKFYPCVGRLEK